MTNFERSTSKPPAEKDIDQVMEWREKAPSNIAAYNAYRAEQDKLIQIAGGEPKTLSMREFIEEMDENQAYWPALPKLPDEASPADKDQAITEHFEQRGKTIAAIDCFTPKLPVSTKHVDYLGTYVSIGANEYSPELYPPIFRIGLNDLRTLRPGERMPNLKKGYDLANALRIAKEKNLTHVFKLVSRLEHRYGDEVGRETKYYPVDKETAKSLQANEELLRGTTPLYPQEHITLATPPWITVNFGGKVMTIEEAEQQGEDISIVLNFEIENTISGNREPKYLTLTGPLDDLRTEVAEAIMFREGGNSPFVVHNASVEFNGEKIPFDNFIQKPKK